MTLSPFLPILPATAPLAPWVEAHPILIDYTNGTRGPESARQALQPLMPRLSASGLFPDRTETLRRFTEGSELLISQAREFAGSIALVAGVHAYLSGDSDLPDAARDAAAETVRGMERVYGARRSLPPPVSGHAVRLVPQSLENALICGQCETANGPAFDFCYSCGTALADKQKLQKPSRRLVTMVFTDFKGFTEASESLAPDVLEEILARYMKVLSGAVVGHGGRVIKTIGDSVMAAWGTQYTAEDDAVNAVKAAWQMQLEVERIGAELAAKELPRFRMRVGVNTGTVWAGYIQAPGIYSFDLLGAEVNRAARCESAAPVGGILLTEATRRQLLLRGDPFELEHKGVLTGKRAGEIKDQIPVYVVGGPRPEDEAAPRRQSLVAELIGRAREMKELRNAFDACLETKTGRFTVVSGAAGLGKSRLEREFREGLLKDTDAIAFYRVQGEETRRQSPYKAIIDLVRRITRIHATDGVEAAEIKLKEMARLRPLNGSEDNARLYLHLLANLLGLALPDPPAELPFLLADSSALRERTLDAVTALLGAILSEQATLLVVEDLHWIDNGSLDFFQALVDRLKNRPLFVLGLSRPEVFEENPELSSGALPVRRIDLQPLPRDSLRDMLAAALKDDLPPDHWEFLMTESGGNPFLLQEMARACREGWTIRKNSLSGRLQFRSPDGSAVMRGTQSFLEAKIDSLPQKHRDVLQRLSVIGTDFSRSEVALFVGKNGDQIVQQLADREFLTALPGQRYDFTHALFRTTAYDRLPQSARGPFHRRWAKHLEKHRAQEPSLIAYHYERGTQPSLAAPFYHAAAEQTPNVGDQDGQVAAFIDQETAIGFYRKAYELAEDPSERFRHLRAWDNVLYLAGQFKAEDETFDFSEPLLDRLPLIDRAGFHYRKGRSLVRRAAFDDAETSLEKALSVLRAINPEKAETEPLYGHTLVDLAINSVLKGHYPRARSLNELARKVAEACSNDLLLARALWSVLFAESRMGNHYACVQAARDASVLFHDQKQFNRYVFTLTSVGFNLSMLGAYVEAEAVLRQAETLSERFHGKGQGMESLQNSLGHVLTLQGKFAEAIERLERNLNQNPNHQYVEIFTRVYLSRAYTGAGDAERAQRLAQEALQAALRRKKNEDESTEGEAIARLALAQALEALPDGPAALAEIEIADGILGRLGGVETFGMEIPLTHARILLRVGRSDEAKTLVRSLLPRLQDQAARIPETSAYRAAFLDGVSVHRDILRLARELGLDTETAIL
ncbi:MAG TPA: adenylate/guanylate cyclase domain-containing protein [bacterium]|nr:adenylate/guanylate cyclase domain-containing protein [bacterium]